jgi:YhcH/YjgK/YiaL family protein
MILDRVDNAARYSPLHPGFRAAFEFLRGDQLAKLPPGRHPIDGERLYVMIGEDPGRGHAGAKLEAHRRYIDIQCPLAGTDEIGWRPFAECSQIDMPYSDERDVMLFRDEPSDWFTVGAGEFVIFYPQDVHAPLAGSGSLRKAVFKVALQWPGH